ncbi:hypothetical protein [Agrobacterium sp. CG674]
MRTTTAEKRDAPTSTILSIRLGMFSGALSYSHICTKNELCKKKTTEGSISNHFCNDAWDVEATQYSKLLRAPALFRHAISAKQITANGFRNFDVNKYFISNHNCALPNFAAFETCPQVIRSSGDAAQEESRRENGSF